MNQKTISQCKTHFQRLQQQNDYFITLNEIDFGNCEIMLMFYTYFAYTDIKHGGF